MEKASRAIVENVAASVDDLVTMVRESSRTSLEFFRQPIDVENKNVDRDVGGYDPVTEADRLVEDVLGAALQERFPDIGVYGEERGSVGRTDIRWIIDPIDGTRAFVTGRPMWGTLVGLEVHTSLVAGFLHVPTLDESYWAVTGDIGISGMMTPNGRQPLSTSDVTQLDQVRLASTSPSMFVSESEQETFAQVADRCRLVRYDGDCYNYALLATGDLDLVIENQLEPYDVAALIPIVEASGGCITSSVGKSARSGGFVVASANRSLHASVLELLS